MANFTHIFGALASPSVFVWFATKHGLNLLGVAWFGCRGGLHAGGGCEVYVALALEYQQETPWMWALAGDWFGYCKLIWVATVAKPQRDESDEIICQH
jgi:hypothetical protein